MDNGNGNSSHPLTWPIVAGSVALLLGVGGTVVVLGGALRQVDVNSGRLDRLENLGSPLVQSLSLETKLIHTQIDELKATEQRSLAVNVTLLADVAALKVESGELIVVRDRGIPEWATLMQRVSALEAHINQAIADNAMTRETVRAHLAADSGAVQAELNSLRNELRARQQWIKQPNPGTTPTMSDGPP